MSNVSALELDRLRDEYLKLKTAKAEASRTVREKYRKIIADEIEMVTRVAERSFAVQLVELRERGATRKELVEVIGDGSAATMRRYVELGGGSIRTRQTGADRMEKRAEDIGVQQTATGYTMFVGTTPDGDSELAVPIRVQWKNGTPYAWPVDGSDVVRLRDDYGIEREELFAKGAEIVAAFGLTEN